MCEAHLSRVSVALAALTFLFISFQPSQAGDIYKWVDEKGVVHLTDDPTRIPEEQKGRVDVIEGRENYSDERTEGMELASPLPSEEESSGVDLEVQRQREEAIREFWGNLAREIEIREKAVLKQIEITREQIDYKKREVEYLLINGYFADRSILELRYLEDVLNDLETQLALVEQEKESLRREARREGIPPGYLRP